MKDRPRGILPLQVGVKFFETSAWQTRMLDTSRISNKPITGVWSIGPVMKTNPSFLQDELPRNMQLGFDAGQPGSAIARPEAGMACTRPSSVCRLRCL